MSTLTRIYFFRLSSTNDDDNTHSSRSCVYSSDCSSTAANVSTTKVSISSHNLANSTRSRGHALPMVVTLDVNDATDGLHNEECFNLSDATACVVRIGARSGVASLPTSHDKDVAPYAVAIVDGNNRKLSLY